MSSWNGSVVPDEQHTPMADVAGRQHLRSASQRKLIVPRYRLNNFGVGVSVLLPDRLRDPALSPNIFRRQLKTHFFLRNIDEMYLAH